MSVSDSVSLFVSESMSMAVSISVCIHVAYLCIPFPASAGHARRAGGLVVRTSGSAVYGLAISTRQGTFHIDTDFTFRIFLSAI